MYGRPQVRRRRAEWLMVDEVRIDRPTGGVDPITGQPVTETVYPDPSWPASHPWKNGKAKVHNPGQPFGNAVDVGGGSVTIGSMFVHVPVGSYRAEGGDVITVVKSVNDPYLTGRRYVLRDPHHVSLGTAYRMRVEDPNGYGGVSDG